MDNTGIPLFQNPEEQRQKTFDLMKQLLATIDQWGKTQGRRNVDQMRTVTVDALTRTISVICVHKELSSMAVSPKNVQTLFQRVYKEGPIEAGEPEALLSLRARKDVLLRNLDRAVQAF
ncbi:MAG TPA: hypothetical protein VN203_10500 [Candidatus Acidoferrum sp.]|nr:hypothetical protein [Candidatus Acidoferrum sp.]